MGKLLDYQQPLLSSQIIVLASKGDSIAVQAVLDYYQKYILKLSLRQGHDENCEPITYVDELIRRRLESKLIDKILSFDINR
ncbi:MULTISPECIES: helix-turn-helix domain-containing protein [Enterococcus]|uniref:Helix-turn-helix domain-containing protein n=1 Tax=Enterococcus casseliflavus TaxID=37734 RepID=A0ABD6YZR2_ENTCA|nr:MULTISPECIES: helix-turn-helix domain-containing protein [Enterococcus]NSW12173.1 helix-turn-helix domain-containing protein [Enterococcus faecalis]QGN29559.1 helix-turn-helix domain-containing protein [Enterococcus casseliflavus]TQB30346.1 helix-turn-helix domain-containing protein [Enterococcus faecalis]